jgi:hypothetical protein
LTPARETWGGLDGWEAAGGRGEERGGVAGRATDTDKEGRVCLT